MRTAPVILAAIANLAVTAPAHAQGVGQETGRAAFEGAYVGAEIGAHEHHVFIEETDVELG